MPLRPALLLALALLSCEAGVPEAPDYTIPGQDETRHVIVIMVDTLRADHMSLYGYDRPTTPRLDELAERGVVFERNVSQSSWTAPSVISIFSGRNVAGESLSLPEDLPSMPELMQQAGYETSGFVLNPLINNIENGYRRGFDFFFNTRLQEKALSWIERQAGRNTFTYLHYILPHDPYGENPNAAVWRGTDYDVPAELQAEWLGAHERGIEYDDEIHAHLEDSLNGYNDDIHEVDGQVGAIIDKLAEVGDLDNAVIIFCSDHGEGLWTREVFPWFKPEEMGLDVRYHMTHGVQLNEEQLHTPLIVWAPGAEGGKRVDVTTRNVDILPTLLELADLPWVDGLSGTSLAPHLYLDDVEGAKNAVSSTRYLHSIRQGRYKLIVPTPIGTDEGMAAELFDLETDPFERVNLIDDLPELAVELEAALEREFETAILRGNVRFKMTEANQDAMDALGYTE